MYCAKRCLRVQESRTRPIALSRYARYSLHVLLRGLVQTIFGKISVIVTLGGGGGGGGGEATALTPMATVMSIQTTLHIE